MVDPPVAITPAIREFLVQHPGEVVIVIFEDYVMPADLARSFAESGLLDFVYEGGTAKWPTLHELISRNQRLIVFAESGRRGLAWLHPAFEAFQETPYSFRTAAEMTCRPNRGGTAGSLFQVNHWIETTPTPRPSNAAVVNAYDFLLSRARLCQRERRRLPNLVAVDFYATGDLLRVEFSLTLLPQNRHFIAGLQCLRVAEIDGRQIHRDGAQDRRRLSIGDDPALI